MRRSKANQGLIKSEVNLWPGALVLFEQRKKHVCARLFYNEKERLVFMSATPSCRRSTLNAVSDIRRELRALGAERIESKKTCERLIYIAQPTGCLTTPASPARR